MTWPGRCFTQSELNGCSTEIVPQTQTGRRVCDSPEPQYGGLPCAGEETVTRDCYQCNDQGKILPSVKYQNQMDLQHWVDISQKKFCTWTSLKTKD